MEQPLISVIVPVYKVEKYLKQCVDSILNQTYKNLEIILVDDDYPCKCSTICDEYADKDNRIIVIHQENSGVSIARNNALDKCTGEYIAFVDSDDWIEETTYTDMMKMMQDNNLDVVFCTANIIVDDKIVEQRFEYFENNHIANPSELVELSLKDEIGGQMWMKLWHRRCWEKVRFPVGRIYEDLAISFIPFTYATKPVGFLRKPLYNYRMNSEGISLSKNPQKVYDIFLAFKEHHEYAKENCIASEPICLQKAMQYAMDIYNSQILGKYKWNEVHMGEVKKWLNNNLMLIKRHKKINVLKKLAVFIIVNKETLYRIPYLIYHNVKKFFRGKNE